ncbi:hypothetical protein HJC99_06615 [Candidatus Saccharibacteria bacterium]|nr:hypothetical protein [Candidatus Saccharibacteria bacterium]
MNETLSRHSDLPSGDIPTPKPRRKFTKVPSVVIAEILFLVFGIVVIRIFIQLDNRMNAKINLNSQAVSQNITITDYLKAMGYDMSKPITISVGRPVGGADTNINCYRSIVCNGGDTSPGTSSPLVYPVTFHFGGKSIRLPVLATHIDNTALRGHPVLVLSTDAVSVYRKMPSCTSESWVSKTTCSWDDPPKIDPNQLATLKAMSLQDLFGQYAAGINAADSDVPH